MHFAPQLTQWQDRKDTPPEPVLSAVERIPLAATRAAVARAPTARPIPAWGEAPCWATPKVRGLKARPITPSTPQVPLVAFDPILPQERTKLILKRMLLVMCFLCRNVLDQRLQIRWPNRKRPVPSLPSELRQRRRLRLEPLRRRSLQLRNQLRDIRAARQSDRKMHMVGNASHAITLASCATHNCSQIGMEVGPHRIIENRPAFLGTEDHVHQNERERQWHRGDYRSGLQPSSVTHNTTWGCAPCWYSVAPSALWPVVAGNPFETAEVE